MGDRGTMLGLSERWTVGLASLRPNPPTEITNKAGARFLPRVLARDCCDRSLYLQMADEPKIRLEFLPNFVCLLSKARLGPGFGCQPNTFQY